MLRKGTNEPWPEHEAFLIVSKNRGGRTGQSPLIWHAPTTTFRTPARDEIPAYVEEEGF
jgi:replicative DNA helicase